MFFLFVAFASSTPHDRPSYFLTLPRLLVNFTLRYVKFAFALVTLNIRAEFVTLSPGHMPRMAVREVMLAI
jgi:hypothetical protein